MGAECEKAVPHTKGLNKTVTEFTDHVAPMISCGQLPFAVKAEKFALASQTYVLWQTMQGNAWVDEVVHGFNLVVDTVSCSVVDIVTSGVLAQGSPGPYRKDSRFNCDVCLQADGSRFMVESFAGDQFAIVDARGGNQGEGSRVRHDEIIAGLKI